VTRWPQRATAFRRHLVRVAAVLAGFVATSSDLTASMVRPQPERRWAVILAADEPATASRALARLLQQRFGYARENIVELYGADATAGSLYHTVRSLGERIEPRDTVLVMLSPEAVAGSSPQRG